MGEARDIRKIARSITNVENSNARANAEIKIEGSEINKKIPVLGITGTGGAGKSSVGPEYIPEHLRDSIFDGDKLFMLKRSEFWLSGIKSHKECKKLAAEFVENTFDELVDISLK